MVRSRVKVAWILLLAVGCGSAPEDESHIGGGAAGASAAGSGSGGASGSPGVGVGGAGGTFTLPEGGSGGAPEPTEQNLIALRIEPADALLAVAVGESQELEYQAFGRFAANPDEEVELTERTVFYVPDNYLVASFPEDGGNTLATRLPADASDAQQRGGTLTVRAQAANTDGSITTATTTLEVWLTDDVAVTPPEGGEAVPADAASHFRGPADPARAPVLVYPNDGVLLPPNLGQLEVHFQPGSGESRLFQVQFDSAASTLTYYTRCFSDPALFEDGACALAISGAELERLAASNQGAGPVTLTVRGSDEDGTFGESATFQIEFAAERIDGAVYYWTTSNDSSIMRFDFGSGQSEPEAFASRGDSTGGQCVGCHALSRQGDKAFFSLGNSSVGALMYMNDLSRAADDAELYTYDGAADVEKPLAEQYNRVLTGSFNPDGSQFVAAAPANDDADADQQTLFFHSGSTGERELELRLPFIPSHPDWSPQGDAIAMTRVGVNGATISFLGGGISLLEKKDGAWDAEHVVSVVPAVAGKNRFNPTFTPDGALLLFSEVDQAEYTSPATTACDQATVAGNNKCNGYSDPGAKTWAVAPAASATPVLLAKAAAPGVGDELYPLESDQLAAGMAETSLMDTYPKAAPFSISHRGKTLGWFTVGSQRRAGLRKTFRQASVVGDPSSQSLLWMFALDGAAVLAGNDGSYPGFFLPFQDLGTSNHMAQWTQRIVSAEPPPPAPTPPPPAPPPPAPPPPILR